MFVCLPQLCIGINNSVKSPVTGILSTKWTNTAEPANFQWQPNGDETTGRDQGFALLGSKTGVDNEISRIFEELVVGRYYELVFPYKGLGSREAPPDDAHLVVSVNNRTLLDISGSPRAPDRLVFRATSTCATVVISGRSESTGVIVGPTRLGPIPFPSECALFNRGETP